MPTDVIELTPEEIGDAPWVEVTIKPPSLQDEMALSQIGQAMRAPGVDGKPQMADTDINRIIYKRDHPEELMRNIEMQLFAASDPEVQKIKQAALGKVWRDENAEMVKTAEKILNPKSDDAEFERFKKELTPEKLEALIQLAAEAKHAEMMGIPPEQMMQQAQAQAAMQDAAARQAELLPASVAPPGQPGQAPGQPPPEVMPSQMSGMMNANAQTQVAPAVQIAGQMRRGKPANK